MSEISHYSNVRGEEIVILPPESNINNAQGVGIHILPQMEAKVPHHVLGKPETHKQKLHNKLKPHKEKPICDYQMYAFDDMGSAAPVGYIYPVRRNAKGGIEYTNVTNDPTIIGYVNKKRTSLWVYGDVFIPMKEIQTDKPPVGSKTENLVLNDPNTSVIQTPGGENWMPGKELQFIDYKTLRKIIEYKMQEKRRKIQKACQHHLAVLQGDISLPTEIV